MNLFLRFCRWALPLLGVSAVISCDGDGSGDTCVPMYGAVVAEYGVQVTEYRVTGKVVDEKDNPIPYILVGDDYSDNHSLTKEDGTFVFESQAVIFGGQEVVLNFRDLDGEENGGEFETKLQAVSLEPVTSEDVMGYEAAGVEVVLDQKTTSK